MENKCIMCGNETEDGGNTARIEDRALGPLCSACYELCSTWPGTVRREYPWLFDPSVAKPPTIPPTKTSPSVTPPLPSDTRPSRPVRRQFIDRYLDLYRAARLLVSLGSTVKVVGIAVGAVILGIYTLVGMAAASQSGAIFLVAFVVGAVLAVLVGGIIFLFGILISAQGQILMAQADAAVHTSPFMTDVEKLDAMSLAP